MLLRQESESILGKCLNNKVQITDAQVCFAMFISYYSKKTHSYKQGIVSKCTYSLWWINSLQS